MDSLIHKNFGTGTDFVPIVLVGTKFIPPFRVGKKLKNVVLDSTGHEFVVFPEGFEHCAAEYVKSLNNKNVTIYSKI